MPCAGSEREILTTRDLSAAYIEERAGRVCANDKLRAAAEILGGGSP